MRFSSVEIYNYRQYKRLSFEFDKKKPNDIHVIIASNGVGKTNLLNAINWCLYGDEPHTTGASYENNDKLSICNLSALEAAEKRGDSNETVKVIINATDSNNRFVFERSAVIDVVTGRQVGKDAFLVTEFLAGSDPAIHEEDAEIVVDRFLPKKIREYFYFDGEQLLNYFNQESSKVSHIKDSIYEIAQVNVVNKVEDHLGEFVLEYQKKITKLSPNIDEKTKALNDIIEKIENKELEIKKLEEQVENSEKVIKQMDLIINGTEKTVEDNKRYNKNKAEIEKLEDKLERANAELTLFVRKYIVLALMYDTNKRTYDYIIKRADEGSLIPDINMEVIKDSLEEHKCKICGSDLNESAEEYLQSLVDKFMSNASIQRLAEIRNDIHRGMNLLTYAEEKQKIFDQINEYQDKIDELINENDILYKRISSISSISEIETAMQQKKANEELIKSNSIKKGSYLTQLDFLKKDKAEKQNAYDVAVAANDECKSLKAKLDFVMNAKGIVSSVKESIVSEVKLRMQSLTMELFDQLLWKEATYGRIELDDNFRLKLFHKKTNASCLNTTSAAEKELLALAFTIALHEVSGYDNLLFIDTPVGRVSDYNRKNFSEVLLQLSSHKQIILAFTPSEYSDEIRNVLNENVVSSYNKLKTNEEVTTKEA